MRTFISIDIPENIKKEIVKIQKQLSEFKGKLTEFENLHLTLKFLGEVDENKLEEVKERLKRIKLKSFESEIKDTGMFSDRIIWLGMSNCEELQKQIDEKLSDLFEVEKRFMGHLTIARVKDVKNKEKFLQEITKIKTPKMKFVADSFNLKESVLNPEKPVYKILESYNLK